MPSDFLTPSVNPDSLQQREETIALLTLLTLGKEEFKEGKFSDAQSFLEEMDDA